MTAYIIRRLLQAIPVLLGVTLVSYLLIFATTSDPASLVLGAHRHLGTAEELKAELGLDKPLYVQYGVFLWKALHLDLGRSFYSNRPVLESILERFPATCILAITALTLAIVLGIPIGVLSAVKRNTWLDHIVTVIAYLGLTTPSFFVAIIFAYIFGYQLRWFPISGFEYGLDGLKYLVLPSVALATGAVAVFARLTRASMLEVIRQDYITTGRAKGLSEWVVIMKHALKNAMIPVVTTIGSSLAGLLGGAFFVEYVFGWPGIGLLGIQAINNRDIPTILGTVMFVAILFVIANILVDIAYAFLDPRITFE